MGDERPASASPPRARHDDEAGMYATSGQGSESVKVVARVRPTNPMELERGGERCIDVLDTNNVTLRDADRAHDFRFDHVFDDYCDQHTVYETIARPMVDGVLNGFHGAILAYGQTGSGKTYTMQGPSVEDMPDAEAARGARGLIPRMLDDLFDRMEGFDAVEFDVRASFIEIYNEHMYDCITPKATLRMYEDSRRGLLITGATEVPVKSASAAQEVYAGGIVNRKTFETKMNAESSRSHAVFLLTVARQEMARNVTKFSQLYLVDLAGSEKVWKTGAEGDRLEEAKYINKSLLALGNVIAKLSTKEKPAHVPYRDSKLTRLLQNSLGGNSRTCLCINLSPNSFNSQETLSTLRFGDRTQRIQNKATVNEVLGLEELESVLAEAHAKIAINNARIEKLNYEYDQFMELFHYMGMSDADIASMVRRKPRGAPDASKAVAVSAAPGAPRAPAGTAKGGAGGGSDDRAESSSGALAVHGTPAIAASHVGAAHHVAPPAPSDAAATARKGSRGQRDLSIPPRRSDLDSDVKVGEDMLTPDRLAAETSKMKLAEVSADVDFAVSAMVESGSSESSGEDTDDDDNGGSAVASDEHASKANQPQGSLSPHSTGSRASSRRSRSDSRDSTGSKRRKGKKRRSGTKKGRSGGSRHRSSSRKKINSFLSRLSSDLSQRQVREAQAKEAAAEEFSHAPTLVARPPRVPASKPFVARMAADATERLEKVRAARRAAGWLDARRDDQVDDRPSTAPAVDGRRSHRRDSETNSGVAHAAQTGTALRHTESYRVAGVHATGGGSSLLGITGIGASPAPSTVDKSAASHSGAAQTYTRYFDPAQNAFYYHCAATGSTTWTAPSTAVIVDG